MMRSRQADWAVVRLLRLLCPAVVVAAMPTVLLPEIAKLFHPCTSSIACAAYRVVVRLLRLLRLAVVPGAAAAVVAVPPVAAAPAARPEVRPRPIHPLRRACACDKATIQHDSDFNQQQG